MAFSKKQIQVTFFLQSGTFTGTNGSNTLTLSGLRTQARINKAGALVGGSLNLGIYGMTLSQMNDLSTLGMRITAQLRNGVVVQAIRDDGGWTTVFVGLIINAYPDFDAMPDVVFRVDANSYGGINTQQAAPTSYDGTADVGGSDGPLAGLAMQAGLQFENSNGLSIPLRNAYYYGSVGNQISAICRDAGVGWTIDDDVLAIWPRYGSRTGGPIPVVSPATGLVKAPGYYASGIVLETLFNPDITFQKPIQVNSKILSSVPAGAVSAAQLPANGIWTVAELDHDLESGISDGSWFSTIWAYNSQFMQAAPVL